MAHWYCTREQLKREIAIPDPQDDAAIDDCIESVSRFLEMEYGHRWYPTTETRTFTARNGRILVDDLLSVTLLETDADGTRAYATDWAATDFDLLPTGALLESPPAPYWEVRMAPNGSQYFPRGALGVRIAGVWGYYDQRSTSSATLAEDLDASETGVDVSDGSVFGVGHTLRLPSGEQVFVTAIAGNTLTVERGANGTTAATQSNGGAIQVYRYPIVGRACLIQSAHLLRVKDAPGGMIGGAEVGMRLAPRLHPLVAGMLERFRRRVVA